MKWIDKVKWFVRENYTEQKFIDLSMIQLIVNYIFNMFLQFSSYRVRRRNLDICERHGKMDEI